MPIEHQIAATPTSSLEYVTVRGKPEDYENDGKFKWKADQILTEAQATPLLARMQELLDNNVGYDPEEDNRPTKCIVPLVVTKKDGEGKKYKEKVPGMYRLKARTNAYFNDELTTLPIWDASGASVNSEVNDIGNGSTGRLKVVMKYYKFTANSWGVACYLKGVQVKDKVLKSADGGEGMEAMDGFEGMAEIDTPELD